MSYSRPPPRIEGMVSLKVDNLTYRTTPEDLRRVFERCGEVGDIYIPRDRFTRESRGFAFVRYPITQFFFLHVSLVMFVGYSGPFASLVRHAKVITKFTIEHISIQFIIAFKVELPQ
jgi:hypothetical protein